MKVQINPAEPLKIAPHHRWGFGAFFLAELVLLLSVGFTEAFCDQFKASPFQEAMKVLLVTAVPTLLAALVVLLATVIRGNGPKIDLRLTMKWSDVKTGLKIGIIGLVLTCAAAALWAKMIGQQNAASALADAVGAYPLPIDLAVIMFLYAWLIGPLCEELIFRGMLWGAIEQQGWGRLAPFFFSTALFAVAHFEPNRTPLLLIISLPIAYARLVTNRLTAGIIVHQINNFVPALSILLMSFGAVK